MPQNGRHLDCRVIIGAVEFKKASRAVDNERDATLTSSVFAVRRQRRDARATAKPKTRSPTHRRHANVDAERSRRRESMSATERSSRAVLYVIVHRWTSFVSTVFCDIFVEIY